MPLRCLWVEPSWVPPVDRERTLIVFRYLTREILTTMAAVAGVLLLVIMGNRFIRYFTDVAQGEFPASLLGSLMLFHLPSFVQLILPLAFFLGIMLAYGQLYLNSEMTVLIACGVSPRRLLGITFWPSALVALLVGACSLWLTPAGLVHNERVLAEQASQADFGALVPGRFQELNDLTVYAESITRSNSLMRGVFIADMSRQGAQDQPTVTRAESGYQVNDDEGNRYLTLSNGAHYAVNPGDARAERLIFDTYAMLLQQKSPDINFDDTELLTTPALLTSDTPDAMAAFQWRVSLALMVPILTLIALPLSRANPRQGRFAKLLPAIFLYISYMSLLLAAQDAVGGGRLPVEVGVWPVHVGFVLIGIWLMRRGGVVGGRH
ncbi:lipopolysaccharide export system permease protein [Halomonas ventosae]|uniref:Lipopolysaccharide export system permease protein LptF n=1 Tax=Halomonas ventosae TaxID=229007 RepID=A0A4R6HG95_9GAMM|nr:lipopolysaccharide export system permease protein [Halomonas ventosae]